MRYMISDHARYKLRERFPDLVIALESLLDDVVKFGGQIGTDYYLLNTKHRMIFPVTIDEETAEHWIKTTLTYDQGMLTSVYLVPKDLKSLRRLTQIYQSC